jgi:hypothetical protein
MAVGVLFYPREQTIGDHFKKSLLGRNEHDQRALIPLEGAFLAAYRGVSTLNNRA